MSPERIQRALLTLGIVLGTYGLAREVMPEAAMPLALFAGLWSLLTLLARWAGILAAASELLAAALFVGLNAFIWTLTGHPHALPGAALNGLLFLLCLFFLRRESDPLGVSLSIPLLLLAAPVGFSWAGHLGAQPLSLPVLGQSLVAILWIRSLALVNEDPGRPGEASHLREFHFLAILLAVLIAVPTGGLWLHLSTLLFVLSIALGMWHGTGRSTMASRSWIALGLVPLFALLVLASPFVGVRVVEKVEKIDWPAPEVARAEVRPAGSPEPVAAPPTVEPAKVVPFSEYTAPEAAPAPPPEPAEAIPPTPRWRRAQGGEEPQAFLDIPEAEALAEPLGDRSILNREELPDFSDPLPEFSTPLENARRDRPATPPVMPRGRPPVEPQRAAESVPPSPRDAPPIDPPAAEDVVEAWAPDDRWDDALGPLPVPVVVPPPTARTASVGLGDDRLDYSDLDQIELTASGLPVGELVLPPGARPPKALYLRAATYEILRPDGFRPAPASLDRRPTPPAVNAPPPFALRRPPARDAWWTLRLKSPPSTSIPVPSEFSEIEVNPSVELGWDARNHRVELLTGLPHYEVRFNHARFGDAVPARPAEDLAPFLTLFDDAAVDPRLRAISREIARSPRLEPARFARRAVEFLHRNAAYSLTAEIPPGPEPTLVRWLEHQIDGYCEHFAGAFVLLARAQGIPARAVSGYLLSDFDASQRRFLIYPSNAHAWAEIWIEGKWHRVEATPSANLHLAREPGARPADFDFALDPAPAEVAPSPLPSPAVEIAEVVEPAPEPSRETPAKPTPPPAPEEAVEAALPAAPLARMETPTEAIPEPASAATTVAVAVAAPEVPAPLPSSEREETIATAAVEPIPGEEPIAAAPPALPAALPAPDAPPSFFSWPLLLALGSLLVFAIAARFGRVSKAPGSTRLAPPDPIRIKAGKLLHAVERWTARPDRPAEHTAELRRELTRLRYGKNPDAAELRRVRKKWDTLRRAEHPREPAPTSPPAAGRESSSARA